jgi:hypothetical protein
VSCMSIIRCPQHRHCILPGINLTVERSCGAEIDENLNVMSRAQLVSEVKNFREILVLMEKMEAGERSANTE